MTAFQSSALYPNLHHVTGYMQQASQDMSDMQLTQMIKHD
jgi:hypothetical protein